MGGGVENTCPAPFPSAYSVTETLTLEMALNEISFHIVWIKWKDAFLFIGNFHLLLVTLQYINI